MRRAALSLPPLLAAACATPRGALEREERVPVPLTPSPPAVLPRGAGERIGATLAAVAARGGATLADCFALAEASNEGLLSGDEERLQALLERDAALANFLPQVGLRGTHFRQNEATIQTTTASGSTFFTATTHRSEAAVTVLQPLFDGFRDWHAMRAAERTAEAREAAREDLRRLLLASVARAFYGALQGEAEVATLEESRRREEARLLEVRARFEQGLSRRTEVLLNESNLASTDASLRRARTELKVRRSVLGALLGVPLSAPLAEAPPPPGALPSREEAIAEALGARADLRAAYGEVAAAQARLASARGEALPSLSASANRYVHRDNFSEFGERTNWDALLTLEVPLFSGGAYLARVRRGNSEVREAELALSAARRRVVEEVESAGARAAAGGELLATYETNVRAARENLRLLEEEYRAGIATNLEVLVAETGLDAALLNLERQRLQNGLDRVELEVALGRVAP
ncbi:MAG TPA: TolC family protein [Planctomycetota bacterium]|nr:TolC family protein [Planctomycetota bacterium]